MAYYSISYCIPYIVVFSLILSFSFPIGTTINKDLKMDVHLREIAVGFIFIVFFAFRGFVYTDSLYYYKVYNYTPTIFDGINKINNFFKFQNWEKGYLLTTIVIKTVSSNYFFFQFLMVSVDLFLLNKIFSYYEINKPLAFAFYFVFGLTVEINLLRNVKAVLIFFYSLRFIKEKNIKKYYLSIFCACLFHISSVLYLPLYFVLNKKYSLRKIIVFFIIGYIIFFLHIKVVTGMISVFGNYIPGRFGRILLMYAELEQFNSSYGFSIGALERFFTFVLFIFFYKKLYTNNNIILNLLLIYLAIYLFFSDMSIVTDRVPLLFILSYCIFYPLLYKSLKKQYKYCFIFLIIFYTVIRFAYSQNTILTYYDNLIFGIKDFNERMTLLNGFESLKDGGL